MRFVILLVTTYLGLHWTAFTVENKTSAALPNMVVFISDDQGQLDSQVYGSTEVLTPNMAKLAGDGPARPRSRPLGIDPNLQLTY